MNTARKVVPLPVFGPSSRTPSAFYVRGMERLVQAVEDLSLARDLTRVQEIVRTTARELTGADGATFVLRDNGHCYYADEDAIEPLWKGKRFPMGLCISGWVMMNRQSTQIEDIYSDPRIPADAYRPTFVKSLAMVPIRTTSPIGAIGNYWARPHRATRDEMRLLKALADTTAVALENIEAFGTLEQKVKDRTSELQAANDEIRRLALNDELTGLYNRRGFMSVVEPELDQARASGSPGLIIYMDLNGLKPVNDTFGHEAGDALLKNFGAVLRGCFREADVLARMGGDEFCVFARGDAAEGRVLSERLRAALDTFNANSGQPPLSTSIGVVDAKPDSAESLSQLISRADWEMYSDKQRGKRLRDKAG